MHVQLNSQVQCFPIFPKTTLVSPTTAKQRHCLVSFLLEHTNPNGCGNYRTETLIDITECEHNCYGHYCYRSLQHMDFIANENYCT